MKKPGIPDLRDDSPTSGDENDARVAELARLLFDLRSAQEADIRALTWIQRNLEGVRSGRSNGDTDLLLGEMARMFGECAAAGQDVSTRRAEAAALLQAVIDDRRRAANPAPVAIFAA